MIIKGTNASFSAPGISSLANIGVMPLGALTMPCGAGEIPATHATHEVIKMLKINAALILSTKSTSTTAKPKIPSKTFRSFKFPKVTSVA